MSTLRTAKDFAGRLEDQSLPGMPPPAPMAPRAMPVRVRARDKAFDEAAIRRKANCRVEEAAFFLAVSEARVREFVQDKLLEAAVRNRFLDPLPKRIHLTITVRSLLRLDEYRRDCTDALLAGNKPISFADWTARKERTQS